MTVWPTAAGRAWLDDHYKAAKDKELSIPSPLARPAAAEADTVRHLPFTVSLLSAVR